ncbi:phosphate/phosphite/phosphonate ABC transporter substrate-binding protein [Arthrobacter sp. PAMC25284]|uniref:phosphate/phosphite/phosphonate ABC transporter substrate-binding protein n=1 Tax=Arthrobacter sp. PAMC25284 TaxID=2861279 RepID=UPI0035C00F36
MLFSNYGRQVDALLEGTIDIAWNTNLAWVRTVARTQGACRALAMRDTDAAFRSVFVTRAGSGLAGLDDLRGRRLALGSRDSAQAAILPVHFLARGRSWQRGGGAAAAQQRRRKTWRHRPQRTRCLAGSARRSRRRRRDRHQHVGGDRSG